MFATPVSVVVTLQ